jgi:hypothetical protein
LPEALRKLESLACVIRDKSHPLLVNLSPKVFEMVSSDNEQISLVWTTGQDDRIEHIRLIDQGAGSEVHEVFQSCCSLLT